MVRIRRVFHAPAALWTSLSPMIACGGHPSGIQPAGNSYSRRPDS
jgi:hypothetical protein